MSGELVNAFEDIKNQLDLADVAERYGVHINRHRKALCPFHSEKTPSFSIKGQHWHCFGQCGEGGDAIDLVAKLNGISTLEAAKILDSDYRLGLFSDMPDKAAIRRRAREAQAERDRLEAFKQWQQWAGRAVASYLRLLEQWKREYAPSTPDEPWDERFCEALKNIDLWDYLYMETFVNGDFETQVEFYQEYGKAVETIAKRIENSRENSVA